jgi:serine/threonine protein kinase
LKGLSHLQSLGIGHRDMSLENILFDTIHGAFIIIDFGMCLRMRKNPTTDTFCNIPRQQICGKKNYISPEILRGDDQLNISLCDVWALGIIIFILITGIPPIDCASIADDRFNMVAADHLDQMILHWGIDMSNEAVELIQQILRPVPTSRLTLHEISIHCWLTNEVAASIFHASYGEIPEVIIALKSMIQNRDNFRCARQDCRNHHCMSSWNDPKEFAGYAEDVPALSTDEDRERWLACVNVAVSNVIDVVDGATHFSRNIEEFTSQPTKFLVTVQIGNIFFAKELTENSRHIKTSSSFG